MLSAAAAIQMIFRDGRSGFSARCVVGFSSEISGGMWRVKRAVVKYYIYIYMRAVLGLVALAGC